MSFKILKFNCCGLDVHKTWIYACIGITDSNNRTEYKQARFSSFTKGLNELCDLASLSCSARRFSDRFLLRRQYQPAGCLRPSTLLPGENESNANILKKIGCPVFQNPSHQKRRHQKNTKIIRRFSNGKAASAVSRSMRQTAENSRTESGGHGQRPAPELSAQIRSVETPQTGAPDQNRRRKMRAIEIFLRLPHKSCPVRTVPYPG